MATTNRLKIPLVEDSSNMSKELWNNAYSQIDTVCVGYSDLGIQSIQFAEKTTKISISNINQYKRIRIMPGEPEDQEQWKTIARANIRCYVETGQTDMLTLSCEGIIPIGIDIKIQFIGEY